MPSVPHQVYDQQGNLLSETTMEVPQEQLNAADLRAKAVAALAANGTYLARANPTVAQNTAQIQALTRECSALIRLLLGRLEDTTGT